MSFFGHRVSTDGSYAVESHVLDREIGMVEGRVFVELVARIRDNRAFDSLPELKEQIGADIAAAKEMLNKML